MIAASIVQRPMALLFLEQPAIVGVTVL